MYKVAAIALSSALGLAGLAQTSAAEAHACPPVVFEQYGYAPGYYVPGPYYLHGRYWHRDFDRDRFERFHRGHFERWDRR